MHKANSKNNDPKSSKSHVHYLNKTLELATDGLSKLKQVLYQIR